MQLTTSFFNSQSRIGICMLLLATCLTPLSHAQLLGTQLTYSVSATGGTTITGGATAGTTTTVGPTSEFAFCVGPNADNCVTSGFFVDVNITDTQVIFSTFGSTFSCGATGGTFVVSLTNLARPISGVNLASGALISGTLAVTATTPTSITFTGTCSPNSSFAGFGRVVTFDVLFPDFLVRYASNLTTGDSVINLTNTGANGASLNGPGFGGAAGNICVNVYAFSPDEQLVSCCSCLITPNGLASLSVNSDLISNTLTGVRPNSVVVKLVNTGAGAGFTGTSCTNSAALAGSGAFPLAGGSLAWGTTVHAAPVAGTFATTETAFSRGTLSVAELASITNRCTNIIGNGSTFGICRSCRVGGLSGTN